MPTLIIGLERLPTLEILGVEYPYDATDKTTLERLQELSSKVESSVENMDDLIALCKEFITIFFCGNREPVERIAVVYGGSANLWLDCIGQLTPFAATPSITSMRHQGLKKAADRKR